MHSACIKVNGKGILLFGEKQKGKSTTFINLLEKNNNFKFVSDDKCYIDVKSNIALGSPQAVRMGIQTLLHTEKLKEYILNRDDYCKTKCSFNNGKMQILPKELMHILDIEIKPKVKIRYGILLDMSFTNSSLKISKLEGDEEVLFASLEKFDDFANPNWLFDGARKDLEIGQRRFHDIEWYICRVDISNKEHFEELMEFLNNIDSEKNICEVIKN